MPDTAAPQHLTVVRHPLVQHKLTLMRDRNASTSSFRRLLREISQLLAYEVTRELELTTKPIETPLMPMDAPVLDGKKLALISILRAGNGLLDGVLELVPSARVGFVGLYRDEATLQPVQYYFKVPEELGDRLVIALDPMLATGGRTSSLSRGRISSIQPSSSPCGGVKRMRSPTSGVMPRLRNTPGARSTHWRPAASRA